MAAAALLGLLQFPVGGLDRGGQGVDHLVGQVGGLAGGGAAQLEQRGVPGRLGGLGGGFGLPDAGGRGLPGRVGHHPVRVVRGGGVGVEGVEGELGAGVAEVVLLPPPRRSAASTPPRRSGRPGRSARGSAGCRRPCAGTRRVTCRSVTVWPLRGPSLMPSSTVVSARSYSWARPRSSVQVTVVNASAGRSGAGPLRQVSRSNPAAVMSANRAGDQPPRSKHTVTRRPWPTTCAQLRAAGGAAPRPASPTARRPP